MSLSVLVVDDEKFWRDSVAELVSNFHKTLEVTKIEYADDGGSAMRFIDGEQYDLIFLDWYLGDMQGKEVLDYITLNSSSSGVFIFSGIDAKTSDFVLSEYKGKLKFISFLGKPFDYAIAKEKIMNLLRD